MRFMMILVLLCAIGLAAEEAWTPVGLTGGGGLFFPVSSPHDPDLVLMSCDMSGSYISRDGGETWTMNHHKQLGSCTSSAPAFHPEDPDIIYAGSGYHARIKKSTDQGRSWEFLCEKRPVKGRLRYLHHSGTWLLAAGDQGASVSHDEGQTWDACIGFEGQVIGAGSSGESCWLGTTKGVYLSEDGAKTFVCTWQKDLLSFSAGAKAEIGRIYVTLPNTETAIGGVWASEDGKNFTSLMNPDINTDTERSSPWAQGDMPVYRHVTTSNADSLRVWVHSSGTSYFPPKHCTVYRSDDGGTSWVGTYFNDPRFAEDNTEPDWLAKGVNQHWQTKARNASGNLNNPDIFMMSDSMFMYYTRDAGKTWKAGHVIEHPEDRERLFDSRWVNNGLVVTSTWNYYIDPFLPLRHYIAYTDIGFAISDDGGKTWRWRGHSLPWKNTTYELAFDPDVRGKMWGAFANTHDIPNGNIIWERHGIHMDGGIATSNSYGEQWEKVEGVPDAPVVSIVLDPASEREQRTLYASLFRLGVYRSDDDGATWVNKSEGLGHPDNMRVCRIVLHADGALFCIITAKLIDKKERTFTLDGVGLYRSTDKAETWEKITTSIPLHWVKDFDVNPRNSKDILMGAADVPGFDEGGLYRTKDGGANWTKITRQNPQHFGGYFHPEKEGWLYTTCTEGAREYGLYFSGDDGATWSPFKGLPFKNGQRLCFDPENPEVLYVTTFGGSVWKGPVKPLSHKDTKDTKGEEF